MQVTGNEGVDVAFVNGRIFTADAARSWASAVAVRGGRFSAVGTDREVRDMAGSANEVVDLQGQMMVPGFIDAHVHAIKGGIERLRCDLLGAASLDEYRRVIADYVRKESPGDGWILGGGWSMDAFPRGIPSTQHLDDICDGRPAILYSRDHHTAWVNSRALEMAGIDAATPDPWGGRIERNQRGAPLGALQERAMGLVERLLPPMSDDDLDAGLIAGQEYLHSLGITGWQDAKVLQSPDLASTYIRAADRGRLHAYVVGAQWWDPTLGGQQLDSILDMRRDGAREGLRFDAVKLMLDGVCENHTASLIEPYVYPDGAGDSKTDLGVQFYDEAELADLVARLDVYGLQAHFHAVGDAAVRQALDAVAHARKQNGHTGIRHHIAHIQVVDPQDLPRFRELNVIANAQPLWARYEPQMTELTIPFLGSKRAMWQYPFGSIHRFGGQLALGSDWPVSTPDPIAQLHVAVHRTPVTRARDAAEAVEAFIPGERLSLTTALAAFTIGSAHVNGIDATHGSIEVGKQADLAVLDCDLFRDIAHIADASVVQTWVAGQLVHAS